MRRRAFGSLAIGLSVSPLLLRAQPKATPVIGWLHGGYSGGNAVYLAAFQQGLAEVGYVEGRNLAIEHRRANEQYDRLPALAAELVARKVDVIAALGGIATPQAAKAATSTIPIVFGIGGDPVALGLVASLARPEANLTGVSYLVADLGGKRLDLLAQAMPQVRVIGLLVNPGNPTTARIVPELQEATRSRGRQLLTVNVTGTVAEIDEAFAALAKGGAGGVVIQADPAIHSRREQLIALAARHAIPAIFTWREFAEDGGLMAYGPSLKSVYRQMGNYAGKILKGAKPNDLPVVQPTTFEFVVNLRTAKALGLALPPAILALADDLIE
jgi:putative ABC transport system substrate-binding protein